MGTGKVERHHASRLSTLTNTLAVASDRHDLRNSLFAALRDTFEGRVSTHLLGSTVSAKWLVANERRQQTGCLTF